MRKLKRNSLLRDSPTRERTIELQTLQFFSNAVTALFYHKTVSKREAFKVLPNSKTNSKRTLYRHRRKTKSADANECKQRRGEVPRTLKPTFRLFANMGQTLPRFVYFRPFHDDKQVA